MDLAVTANTNGPTGTRTNRVLLGLVAVSIVSAPVSWFIDGVTPSMIVYPTVLLIGLWRRSRGGGTLFFGIAGAIFLLVHLPWIWAAVSGGSNPADSSQPSHPVEWITSLFMLPLATASAGFATWKERRQLG